MAQRWWQRLPPVAGSFVMATGIVSVGLHLTGFEALSWVPLVLATAVWALLAIDFLTRLTRDRGRWSGEADTPPALTAVAATTVLGTRIALLGADRLAVVLLAIATVVWPVLLTTVVSHRQRRMPGGAFLVCVSTQGLVVLAATLAATTPLRWLAIPATVLFLLGLLLYPAAFAYFDRRQIWTGPGDQWVATGALAISALAGAKLLACGRWDGVADRALEVTTLVVLGLNLAGYAILLATEVIRPRPGYDIRRWATVFPLGMTAVATWSTGATLGLAALRTVGGALLVIAVGAWLLTFAALIGDRDTFRAEPGGSVG